MLLVPVVHAIFAAAIFAAAVAAIVARPGGVPEAPVAAAGALLMLVAGVVTPASAVQAVLREWNVLCFFAGMMLVTACAERAGFFAAAAALASAAGRGSGLALLFAVFAVGALITVFFSNDATALILTPVVLAAVRQLRLPPLPYLLATCFVANLASSALPVSNPVNLVLADRARIGFGDYTGHLVPVTVAVVAVNAILFALVFRKELRTGYEDDWRHALGRATADRALFAVGCAGVVLVGAGFVAGGAAGIPLGLAALAGGLGLTLVGAAMRRVTRRRLRRHVSLQLFVYVAALFVLVRGLEDAGVAARLAAGPALVSGGRESAALAGLAFAAIASNLVNNFPAALLAASSLQTLPGALRQPFALGAIVGADLGPNVTPVGSLSTMLWLLAVRRGGVVVTSYDYLRLGALTALPSLAVAAALLVLIR